MPTPTPTPKYELLADDTIEVDGITLHRIRALRDFGRVKAGDLGGYVQSEAHLSHDGECWVADEARVFDHAQVFDRAWVGGQAWVCGKAQVHGDARVGGRAMAAGRAEVCGHTVLSSGTHTGPATAPTRLAFQGA